VSALVSDARVVLEAVQGADLDATQAEAVGLLGLVAGQDVEPGETEGTFRIARKVAADRVISTVDPDARHMHKSRSSYRDGYKAHLAVEPETGLVCAAALTPANAADGPAGVGLLAGEPSGLQVLGDAAYGGGETRAALTAAGHAQLIKPIPLRPAVPGGFTRDAFTVDLQANTVTCPAGHTVAITPSRRAVFDWRCGPAHSASAAPAPRTANPQPASPGSRTGGGPPPCHRPDLPGQLPSLAADGGTLDRLAGRKRPPPGPLPRPGPQPARPVSSGGRDQPAPTDRHGAGPYRCRMGAGLRRCQRARGVNEGRLYGLSHPAWPACTLDTSASDRTSPGPARSLRHQSPAAKRLAQQAPRVSVWEVSADLGLPGPDSVRLP
jgi:Transposase DDE domain